MNKFPNARPFAPSFTQDEFEKRILKRIHVQGEKTFAQGLYSPDPEAPDRLIFTAELDKKGLKHLKKLAKEIRKNRGFVSWGKLAVLVVLVAGYLVFNLVFKNWIMTNFLEDSLQGVFAAKVDVGGLDFDPLGGKITLVSLEVADRDHPMRNLFQLGKTGFSVDLWQAVNGRLLVNFLEFQDIRFGSERKTSGALPGQKAPASSGPASPAPAAGPGTSAQAPAPKKQDSGLVNLDKVDAAGLVSAQLDQLESVKLARQIEQDLRGLTDQAKAQGSGVQAKVKDLAAASGTRILKNLTSVRTKDDLNAALAKSADFRTEIAAAQKAADSYGQGLQTQVRTYEGRLKDLEAAVRRDQALLAKTLGQPQGAGAQLAQEAFDQALGPQARDLMALAAKVPTVLAALHQGEEKPAKVRRQGRTVVFPTAAHPQVEIRKIVGSVAVGGGIVVAIQAHEISSDQEITGPTTLALDFGDPKTVFHLDGTADLRTSSTARLVFDASLSGASLSLGHEVSPLGLKSLSANVRLKGAYRLGPDGTARATATIWLDKIRSDREKDSFVGRLSAAALGSLGQRLSAQAVWTLAPGGDASFSLTSDLDRALADGLQASVAAELKKQQDELTRELNAQVDKILGAQGASDLKALIAANAADIKSLADLQKKVDQQTADLERLSRVLGGSGKTENKSGPLGGVKLPGF